MNTTRNLRRNLALLSLLWLFTGAGCGGGGELKKSAPDVVKAISVSKSKHPDAWKRRVVVLGFDSCDPDLVDHYIRAGKLPNFARLRREGASGELQSLTPLLSPVVWTTVATGMRPERHGYLDFVTETPKGIKPVSSRMRQADTFWELIAKAGEPVGVVGWLVSWPADPINGFLVTDREGLLAYEANASAAQQKVRSTWPLELAQEIGPDRVSVDDIPLDKLRAFVDVTEEEYAAAYTTTFNDESNLLGGLRLIMATAETFRNVGTRLKRERDPRLFVCYYNAMDALSHYFMRYTPPKMPDISTEMYFKYKDVIEANYIWHDRVLGEFLDLCDADTTVIVVSDHGFKHGELRMPEASAFRTKTGAMWHRRYGVFFAWGNGVAPGKRVSGATVFDIAPTVLAAMGYPVPDDMPGRVLSDAFEDGLPHETVETWFGEQRRMDVAAETQRSAGDVADVSPEEREALAQLESLGYISGTRDDPASTTLNLSARFLARGNFKRAIEECEKLLKDRRHARNPRVLLALADAHIRTAEIERLRQRHDEAEKHRQECEKYLSTAQSVAPDEIAVMLIRSRLEREKGSLENAELWAAKAVELKPHLPNVHVVLADILKRRMEEFRKDGNEAKALEYRRRAIEALSAALRREPRQWDHLNELARLLLTPGPETGQEAIETAAKEARDHLDRAIDLIPGSPKAHNNRAIALLRLGLAAGQRGRLDEREKLLQEALESTERALEARTKYDYGWANKAYILWQMGEFEKAHEAALEARKVNGAYKFNAGFLAVMQQKGTPLPPPEQPGENKQAPND